MIDSSGYFYPELNKVYFKRQFPPMIHVEICQCPESEAQKIADQLNWDLQHHLLRSQRNHEIASFNPRD